jgi:hypothetical protein
MSTPLVCSVIPLQSLSTANTPTSYSEKRKQEAERIRQKYPDRIPVSLSVPFSTTLLSLT